MGNLYTLCSTETKTALKSQVYERKRQLVLTLPYYEKMNGYTLIGRITISALCQCHSYSNMQPFSVE